MTTVGTPALWIGFIAFVLVMLALDLGVFNRKPHAITFKEAALWSAGWVAMSAAFNLLVYFLFGAERALEFTAAYLVEKALSVDNIFVFVVIFTAFSIPSAVQHRVLFWGVFGALLLRAIFIFAGTALLQRFHWIMYIFGAILVVTGAKLFFSGGDDEPEDPAQSRTYRGVRRFIPATDGFRGDKFFVREGGRLLATPLFAVLVLVEFTDLLFAVDSIPAVFAISRDPFIVFTSNIFAILGLRTMYFLLASVLNKFHYLKYGLAFVLSFVGLKMLIVDFYKVPIAVSLGVIAAILTLSIVISWLKPPAAAPAEAEE